MAVAFRAAGTLAAVDGTSSGTVGLPAGLANGDILVLQVLARGQASNVNTPSGYTRAATVNITNGHRQSVFYKVVTNAGAEVGPTVTQTVSALIAARLSAWSGASTTSPLDVAAVTGKKTAQATFAAKSINPVSAGAMVLWLFTTPDDNTLASQTQGTLAYSSDTTTGNDGALALVYEVQASAAASGTCSVTQTNSPTDNWNTVTLALRPASVAAATVTEPLFDDTLYMVEAAFGSSPFAPTPTWTDLTDYLLRPSITVKQGRDSEFVDLSPGTMSLTFDNVDRRFDPNYAAGPYFGNLVPLVPIRVRTLRNATTVDLFTGLVQAWPQTYVKTVHSQVTINCIDVMSMLATQNIPESLLSTIALGDNPFGYFPLTEVSGPGVTELTGGGWAANYGILTETIDSFLQGEPNLLAKRVNAQSIPEFGGVIFGGDGPATENVRTVEGWFQAFGIEPIIGQLTRRTVSFRIQTASNGLEVGALITTVTALGEQLYIYSSAYDSAGAEITGYSTGLSVGAVYHVAGVLSDDFATFALYVNGQLIGTADTSASSFAGGTSGTSMTVRHGADTDIRIAHVAAYEEALTLEQIREHYAAGTTGGFLQTAPERMRQFADFAGLTGAGAYNDDDFPDNTYLGFSEQSGTVLSAMQSVVRTEQGRMFVNGSGVLVVQGRTADIHDVAVNVTSQCGFGDAADYTEFIFQDFEPIPASVDLMKNAIYVTAAGATVVVDDDASRVRYGERSESIATLLGDQTAALNLARSRLRRFANPTDRIDALVIDARAVPDDLLPVVRNVEPGWKITLTQRPQSLGDPIVWNVTVEGIAHTLTPYSWVTTLYLVPAQQTYTERPWFVVGDATYGQIGTTNQIHA